MPKKQRPLEEIFRRNPALAAQIDKTSAEAASQRMDETLIAFRGLFSPKPKMNETEKRYRDDFLTWGLYGYESTKFHLAARCDYTPDFTVYDKRGEVREHVEVKGSHVFEDSRIKFKFASRLNADVDFIWAQWKNKKWKIERWRGGETMSKTNKTAKTTLETAKSSERTGITPPKKRGRGRPKGGKNKLKG